MKWLIFFEHYKQSIGVDSSGSSKLPATHLFNCDKTNLADDPGTKKCIIKRGVKYPDRVMNSSKLPKSTMFCGSASGVMLPCYVVYKSKCLWNTWMKGGPQTQGIVEQRVSGLTVCASRTGLKRVLSNTRGIWQDEKCWLVTTYPVTLTSAWWNLLKSMMAHFFVFPAMQLTCSNHWM